MVTGLFWIEVLAYCEEMVGQFAGLAMKSIESSRERKAGFSMVWGSKKRKKILWRIERIERESSV